MLYVDLQGIEKNDNVERVQATNESTELIIVCHSQLSIHPSPFVKKGEWDKASDMWIKHFSLE